MVMSAQALLITSGWKQNEWDKRVLLGQKFRHLSRNGTGKRDRVAQAIMASPILMMTLFVRTAA